MKTATLLFTISLVVAPLAPVHAEIYRFEDLPRCFEELKQNVQTGIPIVQVARDLPAAVKNLVPARS